MHPIHAGATAPQRVTALHSFFEYPQSKLFAVRDGHPVDDVLTQASCFLGVAVDLAYRAADETDNKMAFGVAYLVELAQGVVDSTVRAVIREESEPGNDHLSFLREALADSQRQASQARTAKMRAYHDGRASAFQIAIAALEG